MGQLNAKPKVAPKPTQEAPKNTSASDNSFSKPEIKPKPPVDDCYENLDNLPTPEETPEMKSPATGSSSQEKLDTKKSAETTSTSKFKLPQDTKTKADPFSARYDTLRMMPDVQWDNKPMTSPRNDPTPIKVPKDTVTKVDPFNANYDTLLMTPEPKWTEKDKKEKEKSKK
ncbi:unnamed protein product [Caenorhabditis angaria]|uniref:Uncharacterized protein n=1 Tax=Caenorhabditis angaria TaxID=860376 RepID=A0A9P1IPG1_9PELO|nr:unnamed protein product [Caenorhabditis angaria]